MALGRQKNGEGERESMAKGRNWLARTVYGVDACAGGTGALRSRRGGERAGKVASDASDARERAEEKEEEAAGSNDAKGVRIFDPQV